MLHLFFIIIFPPLLFKKKKENISENVTFISVQNVTKAVIRGSIKYLHEGKRRLNFD